MNTPLVFPEVLRLISSASDEYDSMTMRRLALWAVAHHANAVLALKMQTYRELMDAKEQTS